MGKERITKHHPFFSNNVQINTVSLNVFTKMKKVAFVASKAIYIIIISPKNVLSGVMTSKTSTLSPPLSF